MAQRLCSRRWRAGGAGLVLALLAVAFPTATSALDATVPDPPADPAAVLFDPLAISDIALELTPEARAELEAAPDEYVTGQLTAVVAGTTHGPWDVGIRLKGQGSFRSLDAKAAFKIKINHVTKSRRLLGLKKLTLNNMVQDPTGLREGIAYDLFREVGVPAPRVGYARVSLDGESYGLYSNVETMDDVGLSRWFDSTAHLYEAGWYTDLVPESVPRFEVDEGDEDDRSDLEAFVAAVGAPDESWLTSVEAHADLQQMVLMWATEVYLEHWDGTLYNWNNYYLHRTDGGRFTMLPWGTDGIADRRVGFLAGPGAYVLWRRCQANLTCRAWYAEAIASVRDAAVAIDLPGRVAVRREVVRPALDVDPRREGTMEDSDAWTDDLVGRLSARPSEVADWLAWPLEPPGAVSLSATEVAVTAHWEPSPAPGGPAVVSEYEVAISHGEPGWRTVASTAATTLSVTVADVRCCSPISIRVRAVGSDRASEWTAPVSVSLLLPPVPPSAPPAVPRTVRVRSSGRSATVSWVRPISDGGAPIDRYVIQARRGSGSWVTVGVAIARQRSMRVTAPPGRGRLAVRVAAANRAGRGSFALARAGAR